MDSPSLSGVTDLEPSRDGPDRYCSTGFAAKWAEQLPPAAYQGANRKEMLLDSSFSCYRALAFRTLGFLPVFEILQRLLQTRNNRTILAHPQAAVWTGVYMF